MMMQYIAAFGLAGLAAGVGLYVGGGGGGGGGRECKASMFNLREDKKKRVLVIGRGPSRRNRVRKMPKVDVVWKLKRASCEDKTPIKRCHYLVVTAAEMFKGASEILSEAARCGCRVLMFDSGLSIKRSTEVALRHDALLMDRDYYIRFAEKYGAPLKGEGKFTTGLAAIAEAVRIYKPPVYIHGFDAVVGGTNASGEFDNPSIQVFARHDMKREQEVVQDLISQGLVKVLE